MKNELNLISTVRQKRHDLSRFVAVVGGLLLLAAVRLLPPKVRAECDFCDRLATGRCWYGELLCDRCVRPCDENRCGGRYCPAHCSRLKHRSRKAPWKDQSSDDVAMTETNARRFNIGDKHGPGPNMHQEHCNKRKDMSTRPAAELVNNRECPCCKKEQPLGKDVWSKGQCGWKGCPHKGLRSCHGCIVGESHISRYPICTCCVNDCDNSAGRVNETSSPGQLKCTVTPEQRERLKTFRDMCLLAQTTYHNMLRTRDEGCLTPCHCCSSWGLLHWHCVVCGDFHHEGCLTFKVPESARPQHLHQNLGLCQCCFADHIARSEHFERENLAMWSEDKPNRQGRGSTTGGTAGTSGASTDIVGNPQDDENPQDQCEALQFPTPN